MEDNVTVQLDLEERSITISRLTPPHDQRLHDLVMPALNGYVGIVAQEPGRNTPLQLVNGHCWGVAIDSLGF